MSSAWPWLLGFRDGEAAPAPPLHLDHLLLGGLAGEAHPAPGHLNHLAQLWKYFIRSDYPHLGQGKFNQSWVTSLIVPNFWPLPLRLIIEFSKGEYQRPDQRWRQPRGHLILSECREANGVFLYLTSSPHHTDSFTGGLKRLSAARIIRKHKLFFPSSLMYLDTSREEMGTKPTVRTWHTALSSSLWGWTGQDQLYFKWNAKECRRELGSDVYHQLAIKCDAEHFSQEIWRDFSSSRKENVTLLLLAELTGWSRADVRTGRYGGEA